MLNEVRAALKQWHDDTKYIAKIAPSDWGLRAHALANKTVADLYIKLDKFEADKAKELSDALAKLSADKEHQISELNAKIEKSHTVAVNNLTASAPSQKILKELA